MALVVPIQVNHARIGVLAAQRDPDSRPEGDNTYLWSLTINAKTKEGVVQHRYEDGALVLIAKVLQMAGVNVDTPVGE